MTACPKLSEISEIIFFFRHHFQTIYGNNLKVVPRNSRKYKSGHCEVSWVMLKAGSLDNSGKIVMMKNYVTLTRKASIWQK